MNRKRIIIIGAFILVFLGGFLSGWFIKSRKAWRELAEVTYHLYRDRGFVNSGYGCSEAVWREELADKLQRDLNTPYRPMSDDYYWGTAYEVVHDKGHKFWPYVDGMSQEKQDEIIRYLCFRIKKASGYADCRCHRAFEALASYPEETINRSKDNISQAIERSAMSGYHEVRSVSLAYVTTLAGLDWGRDLCWRYLFLTAKHSEGNYLTWMLICLEGQANGSMGMVCSVLNTGKPSHEAQTGAAVVLNHIVEDDLGSLDTGNKAIIKAWKDKLKKPCRLRPMTRSDNQYCRRASV